MPISRSLVPQYTTTDGEVFPSGEEALIHEIRHLSGSFSNSFSDFPYILLANLDSILRLRDSMPVEFRALILRGRLLLSLPDELPASIPLSEEPTSEEPI